jgi:hypothetical protein
MHPHRQALVAYFDGNVLAHGGSRQMGAVWDR